MKLQLKLDILSFSILFHDIPYEKKMVVTKNLIQLVYKVKYLIRPGSIIFPAKL